MSDDWDGDGDEDFTDGLIEGAFMFGPWGLSLLILVACLLLWAYRSWY